MSVWVIFPLTLTHIQESFNLYLLLTHYLFYSHTISFTHTYALMELCHVSDTPQCAYGMSVHCNLGLIRIRFCTVSCPHTCLWQFPFLSYKFSFLYPLYASLVLVSYPRIRFCTVSCPHTCLWQFPFLSYKFSFLYPLYASLVLVSYPRIRFCTVSSH